MKLYHGTSSRLLQDILAKGIRPRGRRAGNWTDYPSRSDMVYLTTAYPLYFAIHAARKDEKSLILEIDTNLLDETKLYPDEDFLALVTIHHHPEMILSTAHNYIRRRLGQWQHLWATSIEGMGNCCYKGIIPPGAITRYCLFDSTRTTIAMMGMDPSISILNYTFCKHKYFGLVAWLFGDQPILPDEWPEGLKVPPELQQHREHWKKEAANRIGVEVCTPNS